MQPKILFVDDDPNILAGYQRQLRKLYQVDVAAGPQEGLKFVAHNGPYAVVVSDLRMPGLDGIQFLAQVQQVSPDTVRIMLTGFADVKAAIEAVNTGNIFRFLTKPCTPDTLIQALEAGLKHYRLVMAERELLENTLRGSIKVLTQILALVNPEAFGRSSRIARYIRDIAHVMRLKDTWHLETAALLSQIGCIMLSEATLKNLYHGKALSPEEEQVFQMHPFIARDLLKNIPRLEEVAEIIVYQGKRFDGGGFPLDDTRGENIPLGSRMLKVVLDLDTLEAGGLTKQQALVRMKQNPGWYDPDILAALETITWIEGKYEVKTLMVRDLLDNMIFDDDVYTKTGTLLISRGQEVTPLIRRRLHTYGETVGIKEPLKMLVPVR
ncbi:MAG: HD domain-containing phosphohydrolase [Desulfobaccales bacterium]